jgi:hypothetical protein
MPARPLNVGPFGGPATAPDVSVSGPGPGENRRWWLVALRSGISLCMVNVWRA